MPVGNSHLLLDEPSWAGAVCTPTSGRAADNHSRPIRVSRCGCPPTFLSRWLGVAQAKRGRCRRADQNGTSATAGSTSGKQSRGDEVVGGGGERR